MNWFEKVVGREPVGSQRRDTGAQSITDSARATRIVPEAFISQQPADTPVQQFGATILTLEKHHKVNPAFIPAPHSLTQTRHLIGKLTLPDIAVRLRVN